MRNKQKSKKFIDVKIDNKTSNTRSSHLLKIESKVPKKSKTKKSFNFNDFLKKLIKQNTKKTVDPEEVERIKIKVMWSGVAFFMILMLFLWSLSLRMSFQKYSKSYPKNTQLEKTSEEFTENLKKIKENLQEIKKIKQEILSAQADGSQVKASTSTSETETEKKVDLDLLRSKLEEALEAKKNASSSETMINE